MLRMQFSFVLQDRCHDVEVYKIRPSEMIRLALEEEVKKRKLLKDLEEIRPLLTKPEETVKSIREMKDER